ncbi:poly [ADP-ribose] polymerase 14 isoform A [Alligator mississippiensis]|uniref:Poly [ADP-ribose] polymerase n=1 Tax=Alligator mississippiensis TaxID=8496 RepID=A0A151M0U8_ALLMI|nr:poly [ADP-ribose] polymerase 14 isoform A [Alligator mississippiensis]
MAVRPGGQLLVCFADERVRQRVLNQKNHEIECAETGKLQLVVRPLETTSTTQKEESQEEPIPQQEPVPEPASTFQEPVHESEAFVPAPSADGNSVCVEQEQKPDPSGKFGGEMTSSKEFAVVVTTATGEDIEDDLLEMYFENKKRSGGGPIKSYVRDEQQIFITFEKEEDAQDILRRKNHSVKKIALYVKPAQVEDIQKVLSSSLVVLKNVQETTKECVLTLLVENISGLSVDDDDFSVEIIPEINAAVITFIKTIDIEKFVETFNENHRAKQQRIKAGHLEETNMIKIENLPPNISSDYISIYFENKKNGGVQVSDVQQLPEDNAALVTFRDSEDVNTVLRKQHSLNQVPISVYPYHSSLGTALYGKEGPPIKKPEPIKMSLNPHIWKFLQGDQKLIQKINRNMADCNCDITWPLPNCGNPQIVLSFSNALSSHKRLMAQVIKTWNKDVSAKFSSSISEYKTAEYKISSEVWEAIRNSVKRDQVLIIPDISKEMVVLVGGKEIMKDTEPEMSLLIEKATKKIEREKNVTEEKVSIASGEYAVLNTSRLEDVYKEYPSMKITYDPSSKKLSLFGVAEDVYKIKGEILEKVHGLEKKAIPMHPYICQFLQHVDNEAVSRSLFVSNQISAFYELDDEVLMLIGASPEALQKAEEVMVRNLAYKCIELEDHGGVEQKFKCLIRLQEEGEECEKDDKEALEDSTGDSCLKEIHLVDTDEKTVKALIDALEEVSGEMSSPSYSSAQSAADSQPSKARNTKDREHCQIVSTAEGLNIRLLTGGIEDATTDVIVSSVAQDLMLDKGPLSKVLLSKAGPVLQTDLNEEAQGKVATGGTVFQTKGYNLGCNFVLHAIIPAWDNGQGSAQKTLGDIIEKCLQIVEEQSLKSITFPAIGTGNLGFPKTTVAKLMFEQVFQFSSKMNLKSLQEVHFLIHPKDTDNFQAFSNELENCTSGNTPSLKEHKSVPRSGKQQPGFFGPIVTATKGRYKMQIGPIKFQAGQGDITKEDTDVIVNISNKSFSLKAGVSKAILKGAGSQVEAECAQLATQPHNNFITTQGGNLKCKKIIHLVASDDIKAQVSKVLQECEERGYTSVAFPAIGTGQAGHDPAQVADAMMDAVVDFANGKSVQSVEKIKIIIFQPHLMDVFHASMKKRQGTEQVPPTPVPRSFFSQVAAYFGFGKRPTEKSPIVVSKVKPMPAIFQICGESEKNVEAAESWIKNQILRQQLEKTISEEGISGFGDREFEKLKDLQKKLYIDIDWDLKEAVPAIRVSGVSQDVLHACLEIQELIKKVRETQEEESKAELVSSLVEWQYIENGSYVPFDSLTNLHLEDAAMGKQKEIDITFQNKRYKVDLAAKRALDDQGKSKSIVRISKTEENQSIILPAAWEDMNQERVKVVQLKPEMKEYEDVQKRFQETCASFKIEKIERIQNPYYWKAYQIKKEEMNTKNGNTNNERLLFHGTVNNSLTIINYKGFNRSYAGMNAANFGNGTYFAVNASYSAHDTYSKPDGNGKKYMYLARVLVGVYCNGKKGDITPPAKNPTDPTDLYDSLTDNENKPSMFIIFNDIQAYPEYLITFTR